MKDNTLQSIPKTNTSFASSEDSMSQVLFIAVGLLMLSLLTLFMVIFITCVF